MGTGGIRWASSMFVWSLAQGGSGSAPLLSRVGAHGSVNGSAPLVIIYIRRDTAVTLTILLRTCIITRPMAILIISLAWARRRGSRGRAPHVASVRRYLSVREGPAPADQTSLNCNCARALQFQESLSGAESRRQILRGRVSILPPLAPAGASCMP